MENRKELNLVVVNIVLLLLLMSLCVGCSKTVESDLNLKCEGKHIHMFTVNGEHKRTEDSWKGFISFKDKRRYSTEDNVYLSDKCEVWTSETIKCIYEKNEEETIDKQVFKTRHLSSYVVNRVTGEFNIHLDLNGDDDYYTGTCEKIEGKKF